MKSGRANWKSANGMKNETKFLKKKNGDECPKIFDKVKRFLTVVAEC